MKAIIALFLIVLGAFAHAAPPPCWPRQLGSTGSDFKKGATPDGRWIGWTCVVKGVPKVFGAVALNSYEIKHPDVTGMTPIKTAQAYWAANVQTGNPKLLPIQDAMEAAFK